MTPVPLHYEKLPELRGLGLTVKGGPGKPFCAIEIDGREVEVVSMRLDDAFMPFCMPTWLLLLVGPALTMLLHACGDGLGWREVDEGAADFSIRSGNSSQDYMTFACRRCGSIHRMRGDGYVYWPESFVD